MPTEVTTHQKKGPLNLTDEEGGRLLGGLLLVGAALALWPALLLGAVVLVSLRALRVHWGYAAGALGVTALPLLAGTHAAAFERYMAVAPVWRVRDSVAEVGVWGLIAASWPIVLPGAAAIALVGLLWDRLRRSPEQSLRRREESERTRLARARGRAGAPARGARTLSSPRGEPTGLELGIFLDGDEDALALARRRRGGRVERWGVLSLELLKRHMLVLGSSGSGKTETLLRICGEVARQSDWRIYYLDAKTRSAAATMFPKLMRGTGRPNYAVFPDMPIDGWRGDGAEIANRLLQATPLGTEEGAAYYALTVRQIIHLACGAPSGPPGSSRELLRRLDRAVLEGLYEDEVDLNAIARLKDEEINGAYRRYDAFFRSTGGALDGTWAWEDVDCAYVLVDMQRFGDAGPQTVNYLLRDFIEFVAGRKDDRPALIVVDEFSAAASASPAAIELVERLRTLGGHAILAPQAAAGLGDEETRERILTSTQGGWILHQVPNPDEIAELAGTKLAIEASVQVQDEDATGLGTAREQHQRRVPSQAVRQLEPGECFVIRAGRAARFQIVRAQAPANGDDPTRRPVHKRAVRSEPAPARAPTRSLRREHETGVPDRATAPPREGRQPFAE
jgi:hypothetical protein